MGLENNLLALLASIFVGILVYFILLLLLKCVDEVELNAMPFGRKLAAIGKFLHIL